MHKVFISYHHRNDQMYKDALEDWNSRVHAFIDKAVDTGDIPDCLSDESIRIKIRDEYLQDSTVTILLVGKETKKRKHIDWELYSSMYDGTVNKKSGIVVVLLPSVVGDTKHRHVAHGYEEKAMYPDVSNWTSIKSRESILWGGYEYIPDRIIDNLVSGNAYISVTTWDDICHNPNVLIKLIDLAHRDRTKCDYDLSRPMRRNNS